MLDARKQQMLKRLRESKEIFQAVISESVFKKVSRFYTTTTTTKPYPTKWGRLNGSNDAIVFYHKPNLDPTH